MVNGKEVTYRRRMLCVRIASMLLALIFAMMSASPGFVFADDEKDQEKPLREVHKVGIGNDLYCFFVQHNVVLTPEDIRSKTDEELTAYIFDKAGLYMKEANCRLASHKAIQAADWPEKNGILFLRTADIESIRAAEPEDGAPVKMYMDLMISRDTGETKEISETTETGDAGETTEEKEEPYSTYKRISPELIFIAVATEADAASGEDICEEEKTAPATPAPTPAPAKTKKPKTKKPTVSAPEPSEEDMLPEYRTINMTDRSGDPIEETLKDGSPVSLEWIEPKHNGYEGEVSFTDRVPGGKAGIVVMSAAAAVAVAAAVFAVKRKNKEE